VTSSSSNAREPADEESGSNEWIGGLMAWISWVALNVFSFALFAEATR
jgi:hypothetical protein